MFFRQCWQSVCVQQRTHCPENGIWVPSLVINSVGIELGLGSIEHLLNNVSLVNEGLGLMWTTSIAALSFASPSSLSECKIRTIICFSMHCDIFFYIMAHRQMQQDNARQKLMATRPSARVDVYSQGRS